MLTGAAIVGALAFAVSADRLGSPVRVAAVGTARSASPTVAATVPDVPWLAQLPDGEWVHGHGGRATPRRLPTGETGLAVSERWVASVMPGPDGRSTVRFRDRASGRAAGDIQAPIWVSAGAWSSAGLVVTGYGDRSMAADGGLLLVAPDTMTVTTLVEAGPFDERLGRPVARGDVAVSPSGRLVAANACGIRLCDAVVVDLETRTSWRPIDAAEGFLRVLTDDAVVTTDGDARWISARRISDGAEVWRRADSILVDPVVTGDGSVVALTGSRATGWGVAAIDSRGAAHDLGRRDSGGSAPIRIWTALSGPAGVVVAAQPFAEWLATGRSASVTVLGAGRAPSSVAATLRLPAASEWSR